jgi:hypothetical protein
MAVEPNGGIQLGTSCLFTLVPNMSGTINVPSTPNGSFVYATAAGNLTVFNSGFTNANLTLFVDGAPPAATVMSPATYLSSYTQASVNQYVAMSWTVNGLFSLGPGLHTVSLYAKNCGQTTFTIGYITGATLTGMVLNQ